MIRQGDIWLIELDPIVGSEQAGRRPAVVISGNAMNENFNLSIVCPLTSKIKNMFGGVILHPDKINNLSVSSEVLAMQVRTISHDRFKSKIGHVDTLVIDGVLDNLGKICKY